MIRRKGFLCVFLALALAACSSQSSGGGNDGGGGGAGVLTPDSTTVVPLQYVTLQDPGANFDAATYKGALGTAEVVLYKGNSTSLSFMVPDQLVPGTYDLKVSDYPAVSLTVQAGAQISDPVASVNGVVSSLSDKIAAKKTAIAADLPDKVAYLDALQANLGKLQEQFNTLSAEDQMKAAQFLAANKNLMESKSAVPAMLRWDWSALEGDTGELIYDGAKFVVAGTLFVAAVTAGAATAPVWLTVGLAAATVYTAYNVIDDIAGVSTTRVMDDQSAAIQDDSGSTMLKSLAGQTIYFIPRVEKLLKAEALFRALGDEDRDSDDPVVKKIFKALDELNPTWDQASAALPQSLGSVPTLGAGKETTETLKPAAFSIEYGTIQPTSVTVVTASLAIDGFKITFDGPIGDFTFKMLYADDNGTAHIPVNGHLGCLVQSVYPSYDLPAGKGCPRGKVCNANNGDCQQCKGSCEGVDGSPCTSFFKYQGACYNGCCCAQEGEWCFWPGGY
jgi:hypothetical protein